MFGTVDAHDAMSRDFAEASRMIVVSVGYRLAPEFRFPEPLKVQFSTTDAALGYTLVVPPRQLRSTFFLQRK